MSLLFTRRKNLLLGNSGAGKPPQTVTLCKTLNSTPPEHTAGEKGRFRYAPALLLPRNLPTNQYAATGPYSALDCIAYNSRLSTLSALADMPVRYKVSFILAVLPQQANTIG